MRNSSGMKGGFLSPDEKNDPNKFKPTSEKDKKFNLTTITPVTIKSIMDCIKNSTDDNLTLDGTKVDHLSICGRVVQISEESNRAIITIDDCTDVLSFYIYGKSKNEMPLYYQQSSLKENTYLKAIIIVTNYQDKKIYVCQHFNEIKNFNEVTVHMLSIIQTHLHRTRGYLKSVEEGNKENMIKTNRKSDVSSIKGNDFKINELLDQQITINEKVHELCKIISEKGNKSPLTVDELLKISKGKLDEKTILNALKSLVNNGFLYTAGGNGYKLLD